jgi:hypothetical protein
MRGMTAASLPEGVIVLGGIDEQNRARNDCYKIIGITTVNKLSPMPLNLPRPTCVVATAFQSIYVLNETQTLLYNLNKDIWLSCAQLTAR